MDPTSQKDVIATENDYQWSINALLYPIFSSDGDYPSVIKKRIADQSRIQGFATSRMPSFTEEQIRQVRGSADFLGLIYFTYDFLQADTRDPITIPLFDKDVNAFAPQEFQFKVNSRTLSFLCLLSLSLINSRDQAHSSNFLKWNYAGRSFKSTQIEFPV